MCRLILLLVRQVVFILIHFTSSTQCSVKPLTQYVYLVVPTPRSSHEYAIKIIVLNSLLNSGEDVDMYDSSFSSTISIRNKNKKKKQ